MIKFAWNCPWSWIFQCRACFQPFSFGGKCLKPVRFVLKALGKRKESVGTLCSFSRTRTRDGDWTLWLLESFFYKNSERSRKRGTVSWILQYTFSKFLFRGWKEGRHATDTTQHWPRRVHRTPATSAAACLRTRPVPSVHSNKSSLSAHIALWRLFIALWRHCGEKAVFYTWDQDCAWSELKSARSGLFCWCIDTNMIMNAGNGWRYVFTGIYRRVTTSNSSEGSIKTISLHDMRTNVDIQQPRPDISESISTQHVSSQFNNIASFLYK